MRFVRWDSSRVVPWQRLIREWLIYVAIMLVVLVVVFRRDNLIGPIAGLLVSGPCYLLFGFVMAKFGYQRRTLKGLNTPRAAPSKSDDDTATAAASGARRPLPTKRTSGGGNQRSSKARRR
jgi:hypothetical protein